MPARLLSYLIASRPTQWWNSTDKALSSCSGNPFMVANFQQACFTICYEVVVDAKTAGCSRVTPIDPAN